MDEGMYIHRVRRPDGLDQRPRRDVSKGHGTRLHAIDASVPAIARERDHGESRLFDEQIAEQVVQAVPVAGGDADDSDVGVSSTHGRRELVARRDFRRKGDVAMCSQRFADDVAEEWRQRGENDADRRQWASGWASPDIMPVIQTSRINHADGMRAQARLSSR
jgi:hypothetical protein